jgi:polysaccharide pyruvyl transferase WcaK-like protein
MSNILVLGFYNRKNIGDDAYMIALPQVLQGAKDIQFKSMDDTTNIPDDIDIVICGGGDIMNDYFMVKAQSLLKNFKGRTYAVSIGIPYKEGVKYLHMFDHVFLRSKTDYELAGKEIGYKNVTYCPDVSVKLQPVKTRQQKRPVTTVGVFLAQPMFNNNNNAKNMINDIVDAFEQFAKTHPGKVEYHFVPMNIGNNIEENDRIIHHTVAERLRQKNIVAIEEELPLPMDVLNYIHSSIDFSVCTRYHSVMFSTIAKKPFTALFNSQKVGNLLQDMEQDMTLHCRLDIDEKCKPIRIDKAKLLLCMQHAFARSTKDDREHDVDKLDKQSLPLINRYICEEQRILHMLVPNDMLSFQDVLTSCRRALSKYFNMDVLTFDKILHKKQKFPLNGRDPVNASRFICFLISERTHHACVWGLSENIQKDDFVLYDAIHYIWECCKLSHDIFGKEQTYYPSISNLKRRTFFNLDYIFQNDFSSYHRSGWSYVVGGLMNLDGPQLLKKSDILLDTYVDRSFHWGFEILSTMGILPYKQQWYGFIHHTFDTTHSDYNCTELMNNPVFIESLLCCKGLFVLSKSLAFDLRDALDKKGFNTPVYTLYHPMEFIDNTFDFTRFIDNPRKKIVQIGAWLRNPYAIYELPLPQPCELQKAALKGKEMEQYFAPPGFVQSVHDLMTKRKWYGKQSEKDTDNGDISSICRSPQSVNKFCQGFYDMTIRQLASVQVIDKLSNEDYDNLLSQNIVFLNLVDCSAVNTVVECIVRNTPIIVNRHPALEEILGTSYPGFYDTLQEASTLCQSNQKIEAMHVYLKKLDKTRYKLETFIDCLQDIMVNGDNSSINQLELFMRPEFVTISPSSFSSILYKQPFFVKYLPVRFQHRF